MFKSMPELQKLKEIFDFIELEDWNPCLEPAVGSTHLSKQYQSHIFDFVVFKRRLNNNL